MLKAPHNLPTTKKKKIKNEFAYKLSIFDGILSKYFHTFSLNKFVIYASKKKIKEK